MGKAEMSVDADSNMEKCNLQVATINQMEEVQIKKECTHNDSTESGKEKIETEVKEGIVAELKEITETEVTEDIVTDGIVTYGTESEEKMDMQVTVIDDAIVTDGTGNEDKMDMQIRDGKETGDTDTVVKEVKEGMETEVTNNMATVQALEREQPAEQVSDKNVTVQVAEFTETNAMEEIRENADSSDTEPLTEKDDDRDSTDGTDDMGAVTIDEDFSKVCSTCPSNPESESSSSSSNKKDNDTENNEMQMKEKTEEGDGHEKQKRLRMKIKRKSKKAIDYNEETDDGSDKMGSKKKSETNNSETEEEKTRIDIKYVTKNKTTKKKIGKGRKDSLVVKTITITKWKNKKYKCTENGCNEMFDDIKEWVKHFDNEHKLEEYSCTICGHITNIKDKYKKHMMAHKEKQNKWKCSVCNKTFTYKCYLQWHELNHTDEKKYECMDPDYQKKDAGKFKHKPDFIHHMEKHSGKSFKCKVCGSVWPSRKDQYEHERSVHRPLKECKNKNCHCSTKDPKMLLKHETNCKK